MTETWTPQAPDLSQASEFADSGLSEAEVLARDEAARKERLLDEVNAAFVKQVDRSALGTHGPDAYLMLKTQQFVLDEKARQNAEHERRVKFDADEKVFDPVGFTEAYPPVTPLWGEGSNILWAPKEPLMIAAATGVGKSTVALQILRGLVGLDPRVLDYPVQETPRVLYLAEDRPAQLAKLVRANFSEDEQVKIEERVVFMTGVVLDINDPMTLLAKAREHGCSAIVVDSLKDILPDPADTVAGQQWNLVAQTCTRSGVDLMILHHLKKVDATRPTINHVFGSSMIANGAGVVIGLWITEKDDSESDQLRNKDEVQLATLKESEDQVHIRLIRENAQFTVDRGPDSTDRRKILEAAMRSDMGLTKTDIARALGLQKFQGRAVRLVDELVTDGLAKWVGSASNRLVHVPLVSAEVDQ